MTRDEAKVLQGVVDTILELAYDKRDELRGPVNWADLGCVDVEERASLITDSKLITVIIEEASPDATTLHKFVSGWLEDYGYKDVFVVTEW